MLKIEFDYEDDDDQNNNIIQLGGGGGEKKTSNNSTKLFPNEDDFEDGGQINLSLNGPDDEWMIDLNFGGSSSKPSSSSSSSSHHQPKKIAEGSYGCVHLPALKCSSSQENPGVTQHEQSFISKIMKEKDATQEMKQYRLIDKIDPNLNYHLHSPKKCDPQESSENRKAIEKCSDGKKMAKHLADYDLLVMEYGGETWNDFGKRMSQERKSKSATKQMTDFWREATRIFDGVHLFDKNEILHHDLKPQNLVYREEGRSNFIDFGLMQHKKDLIEKSRESSNDLAEYHWSFPFEIQFLNYDNYMSLKNLSTKQIQHDTLRFVELSVEDKNTMQPNMISFFKYVGVVVKSSSSDRINEIANKFAKTLIHFSKATTITTSKKSLYEEFVRRCIDTVDIYGLGLSCKKVLNDTRKHIDESLAEKMDRLFDQMTSADLLERSSLDAEGYATKYRRIIEEGME